jgi:hypothetical protein
VRLFYRFAEPTFGVKGNPRWHQVRNPGRLLLQEPDAPLLIGPRIRQRLGEAGHQRGCYRAAVTLAERLCRAPDRLDPPRMFGSHHYL